MQTMNFTIIIPLGKYKYCRLSMEIIQVPDIYSNNFGLVYLSQSLNH